MICIVSDILAKKKSIPESRYSLNEMSDNSFEALYIIALVLFLRQPSITHGEVTP